MNVRNCRQCGKLFNYIVGLPICPSCKEKMEEKFQEAKQYILDHNGASVREVAKEVDVDESQIRQWVKEERLVFATADGVGIQCEKCGISIASGRFCDKCKGSLMNELSAAGRRPEAPKPQKKKNDKENPKMRFLNK